MSNYNDFIVDFPARCQDVLKLAYGPAEAIDREVTLLIMTAAAAFLVPFERLRPGMSTAHPAQDRRQFSKVAQRLDSELGRSFLESPFHDGKLGEPGSWSVGRMDSREAPIECKPLTKETRAGQVLAIIRNALAHGNLLTIGSSTIGDKPSPIEALIFQAEDRKDGSLVGYKYVYVSPTDFHCFLGRWFAFLKEQSIPPDGVAEALLAQTA